MKINKYCATINKTYDRKEGLTEKNIKRVAAMNDLSGFCRCSLTVAIPIISAMGLHCCPFPTAILSNHTGYDSFFFDDYTDKMNSYWNEWKINKLRFDSIYTGFLGSVKQIDIVMDFIKHFKTDSNIVIIDPVMGDKGKLYSTYTDEMCSEMKKLITYADIITPNVTECCLLSGTDYTDENISIDKARQMCQKIKGAKNIVLTGIRNGDKIINFIYDTSKGKEYTVSTNSVNVYYDGTGDVFASVLCGYITNGVSLFEAVKKSAAFVQEAVKVSVECDIERKEGIALEKCIKNLITE